MLPIHCVARDSKLSRLQVEEIMQQMPLAFSVSYLSSHGDRDLTTSLVTMEATDFFTRELDHAVLNNKARIAIHSAKDLPDPIPKGLELAAMTPSISPYDTLVLRSGVSIEDLPYGAKIGASSKRREEMIREIREDLDMYDIRGTIDMRLRYLEKPGIYGIIVAKAALLRLGYTHLNMIDLTASTAKNQGRLAVICREGDEEIKQLFAPLNQS